LLKPPLWSLRSQGRRGAENIENNPMHSSRISQARMPWARKHLTGRANHRQISNIAQLKAVFTWALMAKHRIYTTSFASVYPHYVAKAEKKGRTKAEVDRVISWLTGYGQKELETQLEKKTDFETFFAKAPKINPSRALIKGVVCGVRVEDVEEPTMREIRYLDKLIDELAKGKSMDKILRKE
jgi:hypothetical protein